MSASAARIVSPRAIEVHLTGFAPGIGFAAVDDKRRWRTFWNLDVHQVARFILTRLRRRPGEVRLATAVNADVEILGARDDDDPAAPLALVWHGASEAELADALTALRRRGWAPSNLSPTGES